MRTSVPISGPLSLGDLLDRTFRVYRAKFTMLALTAACFLVPLGLVSSVVSGRFMVNYMDFMQGMAGTPPDRLAPTWFGEAAGRIFTFAGWMLALLLISLIANSLVTLAATDHVLRFFKGSELTFRQGLYTALVRFFPLAGLYLTRAFAIVAVTVVMMVALGLIFVLIGLLIGGGAVLLGNADLSNVGTVGVIGFTLLMMCGYFVALILLFIPAIYLSARWVVAIPAMIDEQLGPLQALSRSWKLSAQNVWRCAGYVILLSLLSALVISLPISVIQQLVLALLPLPVEITVAITSALGWILNIVWQPLYAAGVVLLYYDLRVRRESYDLALRVEQLEAEVHAELAQP